MEVHTDKNEHCGRKDALADPGFGLVRLGQAFHEDAVTNRVLSANCATKYEAQNVKHIDTLDCHYERVDREHSNLTEDEGETATVLVCVLRNEHAPNCPTHEH